MTLQGACLRQDRYTILDGGMGTMLQASGASGVRPETVALTHPALVEGIHRAYVEAGADILCASTFGINRAKLDPLGVSLEQSIAAAIAAAQRACTGTDAIVALDIGPLGTLMEPNGALTFADAYAQFKEIVTIGAACGAALIYLETMTDLGEVRAALLAAKENTALPVFASMSFEKDGRTFTGCDVRAAAVTLSGLGADAIGINCSLGPDDILPIARTLRAYTDLPILIKANAGLPDPKTGDYSIDAARFLAQMQQYEQLGINAVGGCCGTTPAFISLLSAHFKALVPPQPPAAPKGIVCTPTHIVDPDHPLLVGERINPTGKATLAQSLRDGRFDVVQALAVEQAAGGAALLDVNVGVPDTDEPALMAAAVRAVQAVCALPLIIDSTRTDALEAGLRACCGRAIVNSVNAKKESLKAILPRCAKYGAGVIGLCIDEDGIPATAEDRLALARRIVEHTDKVGIARADVYIDCLAMTASVEQDATGETLRAIALVKAQLGVRTILGVSNVSFGLPNRDALNAAFLTLALEHGLDLAILNPQHRAAADALDAFLVLRGYDRKAAHYIARHAGTFGSKMTKEPAHGCASLHEAVVAGLEGDARLFVRALLPHTDTLRIIDEHIVPALDVVGAQFESGAFFLPQLLQAANAAQAAFAEINAALPADAARLGNRKVVIATVEGDVHDIGKNIAGSLLQNYGYDVIDLGKDVPVQTIVDTARETGAQLVGLSALMTTTTPAMRRTVRAIREAGLDCKVMVGGAVVTEEYALGIGADYYVKDAMASVAAAKDIYG